MSVSHVENPLERLTSLDIRLLVWEKFCECNTCGNSIGNLTSLHQRTHKGEKPQECVKCGNAFRPESSLKKKIIIIRVLALGRNNGCNEYWKFFTYKLNLRIHSTVHTQEKSYDCSNCKIYEVSGFENSHRTETLGVQQEWKILP